MKILTIISLLMSFSAAAQSPEKSLNRNLIFEGSGQWQSGKKAGTYEIDSVFTIEGDFGSGIVIRVQDSMTMIQDGKRVDTVDTMVEWKFDATSRNFVVVDQNGARVGFGSCSFPQGEPQAGFDCSLSYKMNGSQIAEKVFFDSSNWTLLQSGSWIKGKERGTWSGESHIHFNR